MRIPLCGELNLSDDTMDLRPIYEHPLFERLGHISQLGQTRRVFPGAEHTRKEHCMGTLMTEKARRLAWYRLGYIKMTEVPIGCAHAMIHDLGHFPFSHALEPILSINHHANGIAMIQEMRNEISACGVSVESLTECFNGSHPLSESVSHDLIGSDKIDYLPRDAHHTGFGGMPEVASILAHTRPFEGRIVLEKCALFEALQLAQFKYNMYWRIYERSKNAYARRLIQKLYERARDLGVLTEAALARMNDAQFECACGGNDDEELRYYYDMYREIHLLPRTGLLVCQRGYGLYHAREEKTLRRVVEIDPAQFNELDTRVTWSNTAGHERRCALIIGAGLKHVFVQPSRKSRCYALPSTILLDGRKTYDLRSVVEQNTDALERIRFVRVGTNDPDALKRLYDRADDVLKALMA
jgi:HD superfamily phosphohydrolase